MQLNRSTEYDRGQLVGAATAALTSDNCVPEFERCVMNKLRERYCIPGLDPDSLSVFPKQQFCMNGVGDEEYLAFWKHLARLVIFMAESFMPNAV